MWRWLVLLLRFVDAVLLYPLDVVVSRLRGFVNNHQGERREQLQTSVVYPSVSPSRPASSASSAPPRDEEQPLLPAQPRSDDDAKNAKSKNPPTHHRKQASTPASISFQIIGKVASAYQGKFGAPRQGVLVPDGRGVVELDPKALDVQSSLSDLDQGFSHLWILFIFHDNKEAKRSLRGGKVRPPQAQGAKIGVFASRSPHRPNPVGLTLAKIDKVDAYYGKVYVSGLDLVDGTPIVDIKPFVEHADNPAPGDIATTPPWVLNPRFDVVPVDFTESSLASLVTLLKSGSICKFYKPNELEPLKRAIQQFVSIDPRDLSRGRGEFVGTVKSELPTKLVRQVSRVGGVADVLKAVTYIDFDGLTIAFKVSDKHVRGFEIVEISKVVPR